jgi:phosphatidylserine decarboxylase
MTIATPEGPQVGVVQIAGLIARRIVNDAEVGHDLVLGDTYGLIRFGSRVDVFLPAGTVPKVSVGQRAIGAETVFADLS